MRNEEQKKRDEGRGMKDEVSVWQAGILSSQKKSHLSSLVPRPSPQSGIAIGVVLFVVAMLAVIGIALSAGSNFTGTTVTPDRVANDIRAQANLIRSKILECYNYGRSMERGDLSDLYPASTGTGTAVSALDCLSYTSGQQNLWTGQSPTNFPATPSGFDAWVYKNAGDAGGRCIRIQPSTGNTSDAGILSGLTQVSGHFSDNERVYDSGSVSKRFILWITTPTSSAHADCSS